MVEPRNLLARLLQTPDLPVIVPRLQPDVLHRVIQACGLQDCGELVALATPAQLARVFDLDLWRTRVPGTEEQFDPDRFAAWIEVLLDAGDAVLAEKLTGLDVEFVVAGFAHHVAVFDQAAVTGYTMLDGGQVPGRPTARTMTCDVGGYQVEARRTSAWDGIVEALGSLQAHAPEFFHRVMRGCVRLSDGIREKDGLDDLLEDDEQWMFDLRVERTARREGQGYVDAAEAHAFLSEARNVRLDAGCAPRSAIARAYLRSVDAPVDDADAIMIGQPRLLLGASAAEEPRLTLMGAHVASNRRSAGELAYLVNAVVAGCAVQGRAFSPQEAADMVSATCNLGLENWPCHWHERDLLAAFQVGWTVLHRDVCMQAARQVVAVLAEVRCVDADVQRQLGVLHLRLTQAVRDREPSRERHQLDAIMMLDTASWAALRGLIDDCPVLHAAVHARRRRARTIDPADFDFIADNRQIAEIHEFLASLPSLLAG